MAESGALTGTGMILGKFLPPHRGHQYLVDFARSYVKDLTVLVCTLEREPIPGALRFRWMQELFPDVRMVHVTDDLPQAPEDHPDFWTIWRDVVKRHVPTGPDLVFASEGYGAKLAEVLHAEYIPVDPDRGSIPTSGSAVRAQPLASWRWLPTPVRPYFVQRVCIFGPESTGKTTMARRLAEAYDTVWVAEHARPLLDLKGGRCDREDIPRIARGQIAAEEALARQANRLLFCDTDVLTTTIWSEVLFGDCPGWIRQAAAARQYDLTLLLDVDVPWTDDSQRFLGSALERRSFMKRCRTALEAHHRPYVLIQGDWEQRFSAAREAIESKLPRG